LSKKIKKIVVLDLLITLQIIVAFHTQN